MADPTGLRACLVDDLPEVVAAIAGQAEVLMDGAFVAAAALSSNLPGRSCRLNRPCICYGLAAAGGLRCAGVAYSARMSVPLSCWDVHPLHMDRSSVEVSAGEAFRVTNAVSDPEVIV